MELYDINKDAYGFIERLAPFVQENIRQEINWANLKGDGTETIADLGVVQNFRIDSFNPIDGKVNAKHKDINGEIIGLLPDSFKDFSELIIRVTELSEFQGKSDFDFLIDEGFNWLMDVYAYKTALSLTNYLLEKIIEETKEYTFYYRVDGMSIENEFHIGNSKVLFVSEKDIQNFCGEICKKEPETDLSKLEESYQLLKGINIKVSIKSTYKSAAILALREAELAVDVLICFVAAYSLNKHHSIPDLRHRKTNFQNHFYWVFMEGFIPVNPNFQNFGDFIALPIDNNFILDANKRELELFSNFIKNKYTDELYEEIIGAIHRFAKIVSTVSNYEKIVKVISLLEGCILSRPSKNSGKGQTKIEKNVLPKLTASQLNLFETAIKKGYAVRNAYVHNCLEISLDEQNLWVLLEIVRIFIIKLIMLHKSGKRKFEDIEQFFIRP